MVFSNLLFIFIFLPLNLICYFFAKDIKSKNLVMLIFSLIFYAWGEPVYILLLVGMSLIDWYISLLIEKYENGSSKSRLLLSLVLCINLILLAIFKYGQFILTNLNIVSGFPKHIPQLLLPIGISFYTFQLITYCVDVYRGDVPAQKSFKTLLLYVSMFHQCIAGPIVRYKDINEELTDRKTSYRDISDGINRFVTGLAKKAILANTCAVIVDKLLVSDTADSSILLTRSVTALWAGVLAFALQIYIDFSAYSDMAIGMGRMIGIHYHENFNYPYISKSVTEFWRRWHISLGTFFRDYLYIPLGGNRKGLIRTVFNLLIVWSLTGLWHGASWNFVLWGLYFFVFLVLEKLFLRKLLKKCFPLAHIYLIVVVFFGWILFKFENLNDVLCVLKGMFGANRNPLIDFETSTTLKSYAGILVASIIACTPLCNRLSHKLKYSALKSSSALLVFSALQMTVPLILLILSVAALVGNSYNPFLYFRF